MSRASAFTPQHAQQMHGLREWARKQGRTHTVAVPPPRDREASSGDAAEIKAAWNRMEEREKQNGELPQESDPSSLSADGGSEK